MNQDKSFSHSLLKSVYENKNKKQKQISIKTINDQTVIDQARKRTKKIIWIIQLIESQRLNPIVI